MRYLLAAMLLTSCVQEYTYEGIVRQEASCGAIRSREQSCIWRGRSYLCLADRGSSVMRCAPYGSQVQVEQ